MPDDAGEAEASTPPTAEAAPDRAMPPWRERLERNALWVALGAIALAGLVVAVGVQVAPETFYDRFWWEDIYGPLVVDAYECGMITDPDCLAPEGPAGVAVKDGYTVTSELAYGLVLAVMLYGIYVGLFRRYGIVADGKFVLALLPWILLGPLSRALEDANVFCAPGTDCIPNAAAYVFISPVIYIHIALYVIAFMLLGVYLERKRHADPRLLTGAVGGVLLAGLGIYAFIATQYGHTFGALPPVWFIALVNGLVAWWFWTRARDGRTSMRLTVFALGLPWVAGCVYLIGRWLIGYGGGIWVESAMRDDLHVDAGLFIASIAIIVAGVVYFGARFLVLRGGEAAWARAATRVEPEWTRRLAWAGTVALGVTALLVAAPALPAGVRSRVYEIDRVITDGVGLPFLWLAFSVALVLLAAAAFLRVGQEAARQPRVLLIYTAAVNIALVIGHMIDGVATWVALRGNDLFGLAPYSEKHPFSDFLLKIGGDTLNGFGFPIAKLLMVLIVVWVLDRTREGEERSYDERNLVGLVKMAIFVLGFAPGLRDLLRLSMGV